MYLAGNEHSIHMLSCDLKSRTGSHTVACEPCCEPQRNKAEAVAAKLSRKSMTETFSSEISPHCEISFADASIQSSSIGSSDSQENGCIANSVTQKSKSKSSKRVEEYLIYSSSIRKQKFFAEEKWRILEHFKNPISLLIIPHI
jgi:hypothetical protein